MKSFPWWSLLGGTVLLVGAQSVPAQRTPHLGYLYPAGARQGTTILVHSAGQYLDGASEVVVTGGGVEAMVAGHVKPLNGRQINLLRDRLAALQKAMKAAGRSQTSLSVRSAANTNVMERLDRATAEQEMADIRQQLANPKNRARENPQLAEDLTLRLLVAPDAEPGEREVRVKTNLGLSNPLAFHVGQLPEFAEQEPNNQAADAVLLAPLPLIINGQIMPGDVDQFRLRLSQGTRLVVAASARALMPYIADAVPGWFQATLGLYDAKGNELAYADGYRFHPDPVLFFEIPSAGEYVVAIKDSIYRGREDFVYRLTVGELPFVTSLFPLGGRAGGAQTVELKGWNLPQDQMELKAREPGTISVAVRKGELVSNRVPFAVGDLAEIMELEPNNDPAGAQRVTLPLTINGRIESAGDGDVFRFDGRAGDPVVAEVTARRLNSPLDAVIRLTDANGRQLAFNDDHPDRGAGLTTHHADSQLQTTLPATGAYYLHLGDAQQKGGAAYAYRLRLSPPQPDFELRVVPASVSARAGASVPLTVVALRKDGFTQDITVALKDAPAGFRLSAGRLSGTNEQVRVTLSVPGVPPKEPVSLSLEGRATVQGQSLVRPAVPAEDMMQAFAYRHLVPAQELMVAVTSRATAGGARGFAKKGAVKKKPKAP